MWSSVTATKPILGAATWSGHVERPRRVANKVFDVTFREKLTC